MSDKNPTSFKFDEFYLDREKRRLTFNGQPVSLTPKAFQTLVLLLQNHGDVVEKDSFLNEVWPDTFVEESTLAQNILTLRKTLRRFNKERDFIVTVPRQGYQFVGDVQEVFPDRGVIGNGVSKRPNGFPSPVANGTYVARAARDAAATSLFRPISLTSFGVPVTLVILAIVVAAVGYLAFFPAANVSLAESQFRTFREDQIVADADIRNSVISPNGKYLGLIQIKNGVQSLYLRHNENGNTIELVPDIKARFIGAAFSPASDEIYYSVDERPTPNRDPISTLYKVSVLGGAPKKVLHDIASPPAISPNASHLVFTRLQSETKSPSLVIADIDGLNERLLVKPEAGSEFTNRAISWSPDGKRISFTMLQRQGSHTSARVVVADAASGNYETISNQDWTSAGDTVWLKDGSGLLVVVFGAKSASMSDELWMISYPGKKARFVTKGFNGEYGISLNLENNAVVAVQSDRFACFLTAAVDDLHKNTHVLTTISDRSSLPFGADWMGDGRIVYSSVENGNADIFSITESGERKQLTSDPAAELSPRLSLDGRLLIYMSNRSGQMDVWRSDANGTNAVQLTTNGNVTESIISPDGKWVFYLVRDPKTQVETLWRVSINAENPVQLTDRATRSPRISPDGKTIACYISDRVTNAMTLGLVSGQTGQTLKSLQTPPHEDLPFLDWSKDGKDLYVVLRQGKPESYWKFPLDGRPPTKLREWENDAVFRLAISRNGERVFYEVGNELNSVVQIQSLDSDS
jgi:DNA-binding winged helix-turn-helix (wHTH) protein/Tol biopolymer transport system component